MAILIIIIESVDSISRDGPDVTYTVKPLNSGHFGSSNVVRYWEVVPISEVVEETTPLVNGRMWVWHIANYTWTPWTKTLNEH